MEPPNATALVSKGRVDVWGPFQEQTVVESLAAEITGAPFDDIAIHTTLLGGGFGRKYETDFARDALSLANAVPGQPVKVIWTREDDMQHAKYRPLKRNSYGSGSIGLGRLLLGIIASSQIRSRRVTTQTNSKKWADSIPPSPRGSISITTFLDFWLNMSA